MPACAGERNKRLIWRVRKWERVSRIILASGIEKIITNGR